MFKKLGFILLAALLAGTMFISCGDGTWQWGDRYVISEALPWNPGVWRITFDGLAEIEEGETYVFKFGFTPLGNAANAVVQIVDRHEDANYWNALSTQVSLVGGAVEADKGYSVEIEFIAIDDATDDSDVANSVVVDFTGVTTETFIIFVDSVSLTKK